jgi:glycosyltransferase involved in cell wall biosynthesis
MNLAFEAMFETFSLPEEKHQVAVWMPCFNAEKWVAQAVESVLMQEGVDAVIILFDDCSTDSTPAILKNLSEQHPNKIYTSRPLGNTFKLGTKSIRMALLEMVPCDYIAMLDADDFWDSSAKLRTSMDVIQKTGASASGHAVNVQGQNSRADKYREVMKSTSRPNSFSRIFRTQGFLPWTIATCSLVIRRDSFPFLLLKDLIGKVPAGDLLIKLGILRSGSIAFIDRRLGSYRVHAESSWSSRNIAAKSISTIKILLISRNHLGLRGFVSAIYYGLGWAALSASVSVLFRFKSGLLRSHRW